MKKLLYLLLLPLMLFSCKAYAPVSQESGKEDMAYLMFVSPSQYAGKTVQVTVDKGRPFEAKVVKATKSDRKGTQYGITAGSRTLKVNCEGKTLYEKKIFVTTQEVKQIILP